MSVKILVFWWVSKMSLFWQLGPKSTHPKNTIKIGVSARHFLKSRCASRNGHFWTKKNPKPEIPIIIFLAYSFLFQQENIKIGWTPIFKCFSKPQKREFSNFKLKTQKIGKPIFAPLKKAIFRKLPDTWTQKKTDKMITEQKKSRLKPRIL